MREPDDLRSTPYQPPARAEPTDTQRIVVATVLGFLAFPSAAVLALISLMVPWLAFVTLIPLGMAFAAARNALAISRERWQLRIGLLVLPFLTALISVPLVSFLTFTCIKGTNSCW
jgi:hypothetical protein